MARDTRTEILDQAEALFAERGFYGVSIAAIAQELGLTKQALLHHFGSKEKIYGAVLSRISDRFEALQLELDSVSKEPGHRLTVYCLQLLTPASSGTAQTQLLMRELLDNRRRADTAGTWYLKAFLDHLIAMVRAVPKWRSASDAQALGFVYQILGAINYYQISAPTLTAIFGAQAWTELDQTYPAQLERLIEAGLAAGPADP